MSSDNKLKRVLTMLDRKIAVQLKKILLHREFIQLQASWAGIQYLAAQVEKNNQVKVKLLNVSWAQIRKDLARSANIEQSNLFAKLYEQEFGIAGGEPFSLLLADYEFDFSHVSNPYSYQDLVALRTIAAIAAASFVIFVSSVSATNFGVNDYAHMSGVSALNVSLNVRDQRQWQAFRQSEEARFVCLLLPKVLLNSHYETNVQLSRAYYPHDISIWGSAIYTYAASFMMSFSQTKWFLDAIGTPNLNVPSLAGMARGLSAPSFEVLGEVAPEKLLTEVMLTNDQEVALNVEGFTVLNELPQTGYASFVTSPTVKQVAQTPDGVSAEQLACYVPYLLCVCRFAHFLKIIGRNKLGRYHNVKDCEYDLQTWLNSYVASNTDISTQMKLRFPLNAGSVKVILQKGSQEHYVCIMQLRPQVRTNQTSATIMLKTALAQVV
jgi:type VI secretion system protein ImpD